MKMSSVAQLLRLSAEQLASTSDSSRLDAEVLLAFTLNWQRSKLYAFSEYCLSEPELKSFSELLERRKNGEPIVYITGVQEFWSRPFSVTSETLIPRPETEHIIEQALLELSGKKGCNILDIGTGTGIIAITLAKECPASKVTAIDKSHEALAVAHKNARNLEADNVQFIESDWFNELSNQKFDLIVSNPPYIEKNDPHLKQGDVIFEPSSALVSGEDGLDDIRLITRDAIKYLNAKCCLMIEHGWNQAESVRKCFQVNGYKNISTIKDLAGQDRLTKGYRS